MHYHLSRSGHPLGQFTEEEIRQGLATGRFLASDLVSQDGGAQWKPLGEMEMKWNEPVPAAVPPSLPTAARPAAGLALTSLISGILSLFLCGVGGIGTLTAIICGHMALSRIQQSGGAAGRRGMALTGLILGYVSIVTATITAVVFAGWFAVSSFEEAKEKAEVTQHITYARQFHVACLLYASGYQGKYASSIDEMIEKEIMDPEWFWKADAHKPSTWIGEPGFEYLGAGLDESAPADTRILISKARSKKGERVVTFNDGSARLVQEEN